MTHGEPLKRIIRTSTGAEDFAEHYHGRSGFVYRRLMRPYNVWICKNLACIRRAFAVTGGAWPGGCRTLGVNEQKAKYSGNTWEFD
jgi:hypothetical protein